MRKDIAKKYFLITTALIIVLPMLFTDFRESVRSELDNRMLEELTIDKNVARSLNRYFNDRVGFRTQAITAYQTVVSKIFHKLAMTNYRYGKQGHIYSQVDMATYQHRDTPKEYPELMAAYLKSMENCAKRNGCDFIFLLIPNKESIYPEFFPDGFNIKDQKNRTDLILEELDKEGVNYLCLIDKMRAKKDKELLYNKKYDVLHWNDRGALLGMQELIKELHNFDDRIEVLEEDEVIKGVSIQKKFPNSNMIINEIVPDYEIKNSAIDDTDDYFRNVNLKSEEDWKFHYINSENKGNPKILVFGDSYFGFFSLTHDALNSRASELTLIYTNNMNNAENLISKIDPDIVIVEAVERVLTLDSGQWSMESLNEGIEKGL